LSNAVSDSNEQFSLWQAFDSEAAPAPANNFTPTSSGVANGEGHGFQTFASGQGETPQGDGFISMYQPTAEAGPQAQTAAEPTEPDPEAEAQKLAQQAYEDGFAQGQQDGLEAGRQEIAQVLQRISEFCEAVENLWPDLVQQYEQQIVDLVLKASEKLVLGQIQADPEVVKRSILHAFEVIPEPVEMTLEVNPEDYEFIETVKVDFFDQIKTLKHVNVIAEPSIRQGGCQVNTPSGQVNATLEARLDAVRRSIAGSRDPHGDNPSETN
jgi:flagellar assembly protein FliH